MGLLEKRNPRATRQSVIRSAWVGAIGGVVFAFVASWLVGIPTFGRFFIAPFMAAGGAIAAAAIEWQLDDEDASDDGDSHAADH
jgi:hypothetical protein